MDQQENQAKTILAKKVKRQTVRYESNNSIDFNHYNVQIAHLPAYAIEI